MELSDANVDLADFILIAGKTSDGARFPSAKLVRTTLCE